MARKARKVTFQEAWDSATVFYNDATLERKIDEEVGRMSKLGADSRVSTPGRIEVKEIAEYLSENPKGLGVLLADIALSREKFLRILTLLRRIGDIPGGFDKEWAIDKVRKRIVEDKAFALRIAKLLIDGNGDPNLTRYLPKYYREKLNLRGLGMDPPQKRRLKFKESKAGTYAALKGKAVEELIGKKLRRMKARWGLPYASGRTRLINTDVDWALPSAEDPYVLIMVSYQETTSSGQSTKARDMFAAYQKVHESNVRNNEDRAFVNFVDGGGWLARRNDFRRLVTECHYFVNLRHIGMLGAIIRRHVPKRFFSTTAQPAKHRARTRP